MTLPSACMIDTCLSRVALQCSLLKSLNKVQIADNLQ
jgi:hypothetical protein